MLRVLVGIFWGCVITVSSVAQQPYTWSLTQSWNPTTTTWDSATRSFVTYNANQRMETYRTESYQANSWINFSLARYTYHVNGTDIDSFFQFNWNQSLGNYTPTTLSVYSYLGPGQTSLTAYSNWDSQSQQYKPTSRVSYTYNAALAETELYETYDATSQTYLPSYRYNFTYTASNKVQARNMDIYTGGQWLNSSRITYTYNANDDIVYILGENYQQSSWVNSYAQNYSYNMYQELSQILTSGWSGGAWQQQNRIIYTYNQDGTIDTYTTYVWQNNNFVNSQKGTFFYQLPTNAPMLSQPAIVTFFPNPAKDYLIVTGVPTGTIILRAMDGKLLHQLPFTSSQPTCVTDIPSGMYLIEVVNSEQHRIAAKQIFIQH